MCSLRTEPWTVNVTYAQELHAHPQPMSQGAQSRFTIVTFMALALAIHVWGIQRALPFGPDVDEPTHVIPAVAMAASGDLNPGWFGHPGSTVTYPLAAVYALGYLLGGIGNGSEPRPGVEAKFLSAPADFYLTGRVLTVLYAVFTIPLVYMIGREALGGAVAVIGSGLMLLYPITVAHGQMVRSDSGAVFFGMVALWLFIRLYDQPTLVSHARAGAAVGLAIATRYFMATLVPVLMAIPLIHPLLGRHWSLRLRLLVAASLAVVVGFVVATPYFVLDFGKALDDIRGESRATHLGADGLSRVQNLTWYAASALPTAVGWPQMAAFVVGAVAATRARRPKPLLLLAYFVVFVMAISLSRLHWQRWLIPILPIVALFGASGLCLSASWLAERLRRPAVGGALGLTGGALVLAAIPAFHLINHSVTRDLRTEAREWLLANVQSESRIAVEWYTAPLVQDDFFLGFPVERYTQGISNKQVAVLQRYSLAEGHTLEDYRNDGYDYLVVSSALYGRYTAEPARYPAEVAFYQRLATETTLVWGAGSSSAREGFESTAGHLLHPDIRIYSLHES